MLEVLKALLLGIIQGLTEWLPISSTGHLLLLDELLQVSLSPKGKELFMVIIQFASILAVILLYFSLLNPFSPKKDKAEKNKTGPLGQGVSRYHPCWDSRCAPGRPDEFLPLHMAGDSPSPCCVRGGICGVGEEGKGN